MCIDLTLTTMLVSALGAIGANATVIILACNVNDAACRDATRAAAQTTSSTQALMAAQAQLTIHSTAAFFVSQPALSSTNAPDFVYNDFGGNPPTDTSPYVAVSTSVNISIPAPILFFGTKFGSAPIVYKKRYVFPIIKEKFYG
jgi:hypothetical protein